MEEENRTQVGFWSFIFVIAIVISNLNSNVWEGTGTKLIFTGVKVLPYFMFLSGYYLMVKVKKKQKESVGNQAWNYTKNVISTLYPPFLGGVVLAFIVQNVIAKTRLSALLGTLMNSLGEFLGFTPLLSLELGSSATYFNITSQSLVIWNKPLWLLSGIVVAGLVLYYIAAKNEDFFKTVFAPLFLIISYIYLSLNLDFVWLPKALIIVMAGMSAGMLLYYLVEHLQHKKFSDNLTMFFSILHIGLAMFILYTCYAGFNWSNISYALVIYLFCLVLLTNKDYIATFYNKSKICAFLGKITLYIYVCHIAFIDLIPYLFPYMDYMASIIFTSAFTICFAMLMYYVDMWVISPIFRKKKRKELFKK